MEQLLALAPSLLLVSMRLAGVVTASPVFNNKFMPGQSRVIFTFLLALLLLPTVKVAPEVNGPTGLLIASVVELLIGLLIGFLNALIFAVVEMAGAWLDLDMGFSMSSVLNPTSGMSEPLIATFFQTLALVIYLTINGHHWLLRALAESYQAIPAGGLNFGAQGPMYAVELFGTLLSLAIQMALPFVAVMLMMTTALAGINRAMPQLNIFSLGLGLKAVVGMVMLVVFMPFFLSFLGSLFQSGHAQLLKVLDILLP